MTILKSLFLNRLSIFLWIKVVYWDDWVFAFLIINILSLFNIILTCFKYFLSYLGPYLIGAKLLRVLILKLLVLVIFILQLLITGISCIKINYIRNIYRKDYYSFINSLFRFVMLNSILLVVNSKLKIFYLRLQIYLNKAL